MARVIHIDQIPKSAIQAEVASLDIMLEDFDIPHTNGNGFARTVGVPGTNGNGFAGTADIPLEPPEKTLAENIVKAAELQAQEIITRAKNQADGALEKAEATLGSAQADADRIVADAQVEATQLQEQANFEIDQAFQRAQSEGYEGGFTEGQKLAIKERNAEIDQLTQTLQDAINEVATFEEKLAPQYEAEILELVLVLATKIVGFELSIQPNLIFEVVKSGIELLKDKRELTIHLSPGDLELVRKYRPELLEQIEGIGQIYLTADENLIVGECLIENKSNFVDSTWRRKISHAAETVWALHNQQTASAEGEIIGAATTN